MSVLTEDRLNQITDSLAEYSESSVRSAIEAARDPEIARQLSDRIDQRLKDTDSGIDFSEIGLYIALSEAGATDAIPTLLRAADDDLFDTPVYTEAAIYALQRMRIPAFEAAMRHIEATSDDAMSRMSAGPG